MKSIEAQLKQSNDHSPMLDALDREYDKYNSNLPKHAKTTTNAKKLRREARKELKDDH
ncbi:hypothetical protein KS4_23780 [Poriferisphaera corsica]|uniref:Uncharacterized protein n=1 Tax=Poriferisphaera corsica TaxID=2528020 RepID=A0A517YVP8_9BACT|nr:hypothetical protein [Poriferisphaera corsica]QDU34311.1 hypothetical protein KS4_23780 [Poriferisphaera corsica]